MKRNLEWQQDAACLHITHFQDDPKDHADGWTTKQRKQLCLDRCKVRGDCLEYAKSFPLIEASHRNLVFGGYTGREVAKMIRDKKKQEA